MWASKNKQSSPNQTRAGFTIVELLIVIVVIAILAAITVVAYNGIQQRAKDSQRKSDIAAITKALELYYIDNGRYPAGSGSTTINASWSTTADASWQNLATALAPYSAKLPTDPISTPSAAVTSGTGYNYAYYANNSTFCGAAVGKMYILVYRLEGAPREDTFKGDCPSNVLWYGSSSNYRVVKD
jgi:type II secretion system protein G